MNKTLKSVVLVSIVTATLTTVARDWYVDANYGDDDWDGSCPYSQSDRDKKVGPKRTLRGAMEVEELGDNDVVHAARGVYKEKEMNDGSNDNRVILSKKNLGLVADEGRDVTFIEGRISADHESGNGNGAVRCVKVTGEGAYVRGFTLDAGRTDTCGAIAWNYAGGCFCGASAYSMLVDCVVTNGNAGYRGAIGGSSPIYVIGCLVYAVEVKNARSEWYTSYGPISYINSIVHGIPSQLLQTPGGVHLNSVFPEGSPWQSTRLYNCFLGAMTDTTPDKPTEYYHCYSMNHPAGAYWYNCKQVTAAEVKFESGTYRPLEGSVLIDKGVNEDYLTNFPSVVKSAYEDLAYGMKTPRFLGDSIDIGAYEYGNRPDEIIGCLTDHPNPIVSNVTGGVCAKGDYVALPDDAEFSIVWSLASAEVTSNEFSFVASAGLGAVLKIYLDDSTEPTWTVVPAEGVRTNYYVAGRHVIRFRSEGDTASSVQSIATDVRTPYFVKPTGDNAADGKSFATARKTLKGALEIPGLVAGDIIYVAPGVYAEDAMWDGCNSNRVIVATGLGLYGYAGPEETFIKGCYATTDTKCGPDAVRCANVKRGAFVRGFTLYNGATASNVTETLKHAANNSGGNAFVEAGGALIDCVVSNGVAFYRGGGCGSVEAAAGDYIRCRFTNGIGLKDTVGSCCLEGCYYNCVFDSARGSGSVYTTRGHLVNCLFLNDARSQGNGVAYLYNCVLDGSDNGRNEYHRCVISADSLKDTSVKCDGTLLGQGRLLDMLDEKLCPRKGTLLVDFGDTAHYLTNFPTAWIRFADTDFSGGQRIYNRMIDAGAGEYDWRTEFAKRLSSRNVNVEMAEAGVATNAVAGIDIPNGETLRLRISFTKTNGVCSLSLKCAGVPCVKLGTNELTGQAGCYQFAGETGMTYEVAVIAVNGDVTVSSISLPKTGMCIMVR